MTNLKRFLIVLAAGITMLSAVGCTTNDSGNTDTTSASVTVAETSAAADSADNEIQPISNEPFDLNNVPEYSDTPFVEVNDNKPYFTKELIKQAANAASTDTFLFETDNEEYQPLDDLGRCQAATGLLSKDTMPPDGEEREGIGMIKPAGWHTIKYPDVISDLYLYNRCHLIGWQLGSENANEKNLTTGTRYLNTEGMLPFENKTADYIKSTGNHVLYRVTPVFVDDELICRGVLIEARSIEDTDLEFCIYCYNVQPYIKINYLTGDSEQIDTPTDNDSASVVNNGEELPKDNLSDEMLKGESTTKYILNTSSKKIHMPNCSAVDVMSEDNKEYTDKSIDELENEGYEPCKLCNPS